MTDTNKNREILMNHYTKPTNFGLLTVPNLYQKRLKSDSCADDLTLQIQADQNQVFQNLAFEGSACIIATSSMDLWCSLLKGKTFAQAKALIDAYVAIIERGVAPEPQLADLGVFANVHQQKGRWKCALLGARGIEEFIQTQQ